MASMSDQRRSFVSLEAGLYLGLLALAVGLRFLNLGLSPLNDPEAREALAALRFLRGQPELALPHSPAYFSFTALSFFLLGASEVTARLTPALCGAGLVLLPWLFRDALGRAPALVTAALLAISSGLLAASRSADGSLIALFTFALGLGLAWRSRRSSPAAGLIGAAAAWGVGLASGAPFLTGLLITLVAAVFILRRDEALRQAWDELRARLAAERAALLTALAVSAVVTATFALMYRSGFGALGVSLAAWFAGFVPGAGAGRSLGDALTFLSVYDPLILVFGAAGVVRAVRREDRTQLVLSWFAVLAFVFVMFYSGRTLFDLIWVLTPLAALAAQALCAVVGECDWRQEGALIALQSAVVVTLLAYIVINLTGFVEQSSLNPAFWQVGYSPENPGAQNLFNIVMALVVTALVFVIFTLGWSSRATRHALSLTGAAMLTVATLGAGWGQAQLRPDNPIELWWARPTAMDVHRLVSTLTNVSNLSVGQEREIVVTVEAWPIAAGRAQTALTETQTGALAWALRDFINVKFIAELGAQVDSPVVITAASRQNPALGSAYLGQDFPAYRFWYPQNQFWFEQVGWLFFRRAQAQTENAILWVRQDIAQPPSPLP
jgi:hypothetical protein